MQNVDSVIASVKNLPSLPTVALKIIQEIKKDKVSNNSLTEIISYDPALTTKILKIAEVLNNSIRRPDIAARYGGEEFAIILPETDLKGALVLADRLRQLVEDLDVNIDGEILKVTISLGITSYDPSKGKKSKEEIIESADKALYNSKNTGRNKLSIAQ